MMTGITIGLLLLLIIIYKTCIVVQMREAIVIQRLGKFHAALRPGLHFLLPFFDRIAYRHEMREQVFDVPSQSCITRDNIQVEIDGLVYLKVMDPQKASYGIADYKSASINLAQTTMRSEVGKLALSQTFSERDALNETIVKEIDKASDPWGIKVLRYEIKNIIPSAQVVLTLEKQMEAERQKRAEITLAMAEKESVIAQSEGERQEAINLSEGERQRRINEAAGRANEISILAEATAEGVSRIAQAITKPGGDTAVNMRLVEHFIEEFGHIIDQADVSVVPSNLANIKGFFEGVSELSNVMKRG